jgi:scyllo-inositol 2-dehydrogenase (NADP+)
MMAANIKLGIAGFGRIVELTHLPMIKSVPDMEVGGIFDVTMQRLTLASKRGFTVYQELDELLTSPIDAVLIASPPNSHYSIAEKALLEGKHVLIEKPVTVTSEEAIQLRKVAQQVGKKVSVFQNRRFDGSYLLVKQMIDDGTLGTIQFAKRRQHMFGSGSTFGVKSFRQEWRNEKAYGGGALLDWGVHLIDQLLGLGLGECKDVYAFMRSLNWKQGDVEDYVHAELITDQNIPLSMEINFASNAVSPLWIVGGDRATLQVNSEREAYIFEKGKPPQEVKPTAPAQEGAVQIYTTFMDAILHGGELAVTLDEAIATMKVIDRIRNLAYKETNNGN